MSLSSGANLPEDKAVNLPGKETGNFSGAETQDPSEMEVQNPLGDLPEAPSEDIDRNPTEPKAKDDANDEIPTVETTNVHTDTDVTVRRSISFCCHFNVPRVSTALTNSLNNSASRDWFTSIPFKRAETVVTQQPF